MRDTKHPGRRRVPSLRVSLAFAIAVLLVAALAIVACSSSTAPETETPDAEPDTSPLHDGGLDSSPMNPDTSPQGGGHCPPDGSPLTSSPCDLVLQDCPKDTKGRTQECVENGTATECVPVTASEQLGLGRACCQGDTGNSCLPGLSCIGAPCVDGGPMTGRCSPACCDDKACGKSDPEGISGACDIIIVDDKETPLYNACTYRQRCQLFQVEPCMNAQGCEVDDLQGTSTCIDTAGKGAGAACSFKNDCADGLICAADGTCRTMCLVFGTVSPYDAGLVTAAPGHGGCPAGQKCSDNNFSNLPRWLGTCGP